VPLTLTIRNATRLDNGSPLSLVLDRRGAVIGRAATCDWCLPDPSLHISSRHCEVRFAADRYELIDKSTNGTFIYGQANRLPAAHVINQDDVFLIGQFEVAARLDDASAAAAANVNATAAQPEWRGWNALGDADAAAAPATASAWDAIPGGSAISGAGPMSQNWAAPATASSPAPVNTLAPVPGNDSNGGWGAPPPSTSAWASTPTSAPASPPPWNNTPPSVSTWDTSPAPAPAKPASDWSSPAAPAQPAGADEIWGKFVDNNVVDWARGGLGVSPPPPSFGVPPPTQTKFASAPSPQTSPSEAPAFAPAPSPAPQPSPPAQAAPSGTGLASFAAAAGVEAEKLKQGEAETLSQAGALLRRMVAGLVVMLEARMRAKSQMGAQSTNLEFDGNNPLKFARTPEAALTQLLNPQERGFMATERAVDDAFKDLQAHQMATLKAMQGALRATLDRFSPSAIRARAEKRGIMSRIMPGARDAALWAAYEKEFGGVALGSDEAFMDMFAKEFRRAYEEISAKR
jgi:type VI secretion system protein